MLGASVGAGAVSSCAHGGDRLLVLVPGGGAGAGAVSWLCTWWRQVAGAGWRVPALVLVLCGAGAGCRAPVRVLCCELARLARLAVVPGAGAGRWCGCWWVPVLVLVL